MVKLGLILAINIGALLFLTTCQDNESKAPSITSIEPTRGWKEAHVKITGINFDPQISGNKVRFDGQLASIVSSTSTEIIVRVPESETGIVSVVTENGLARGPVFSYAMVPKLKIIYATWVDASEATLNAELTEISTHEIKDHGFIYSKGELTVSNPGIKISLSSIDETGKFQKRLTGLLSKQKYFFYAFATIKEGTIVTDQLSFETVDVNLWGRTLELPSSIYRSSPIGRGVEINNKIYLEFSSATLPVYEYDPATALFMKLTDFPGRYRSSFSVLALRDTLYMGLGNYYIGTNPTNLKDIWSFSPSTKIWKKGKDFPIEIYNTSTFVLNGRGYLMGSDFDTKKSTIWEYSFDQNLWLQKKGPPSDSITPINAFSSNGRGYIIAASSNINNGIPSVLWEYDPVNDEWASRARLPVKFYRNIICLSSEKKGYVIELYGKESPFFEYNPMTDTWRELNRAPFSAQSGFVFNNKIFATDGNYMYTYLPE